MRKMLAIATLLVSQLSIFSWSAHAREPMDLGSPCSGIEGVFAYSGEPLADSGNYALGLPPNIGLLLYPKREIAFAPDIHRYRVLIDNGWPVLELHGRRGPIGKLDMLAEGDTAYCLDDELTIVRQHRERTGSVYNYSRHEHRLRRGVTGELLVETVVTGKYRTKMMSWDRQPERYAARFTNTTALR